MLTISRNSGNVRNTKEFLEKVWKHGTSTLSASTIENILSDLLPSGTDNHDISPVMKDISQTMSAMGLSIEGGIFANGKYIKKDRVYYFYKII